MSKILDYWPDPNRTPRKSQIEALQWIEENIGKKKYLFLEAPVGAGKSLIGLTVSRYLEGNAFVLTPQRILQKQYESEFATNEQIRLRSLVGKSNYKCSDKNTSCDVGSMLKPTCNNCPHKAAKEAAVKSKNTVLNYDLALLNFAFTDTFKTRKLMILDECHSLEQILTEFDAIGITFNQMQEMNVKWTQLDDIVKAHKWVVDKYLPNLKDRVADLEAIATPLLQSGDGLNPDEIKLIKNYEKLNEHLDEITELELLPEQDLKDNYILVHDKLNVKFKRLYAGTTFKRYIRPQADNFLFMSSTILNYEGYCKDNGIPPEEATFLSLESEFPEENRQVYYMPQMKMNVTWDKPETKPARRRTLKHIEDLCEMHKTDSGIIHTANFKIAEWLVENLDVPQKIYHHNPDSGDDRNSIIEAFQDSPKPGLLISPSITEGLDLKDDLSRFAIIAKTPFPYMGDQWVKARQELSTEWYRRQALIDVIQGCGRIVRSKDDYGNVYIIDESWAYLYSQSQNAIPQWWKDSYRVME
jgi:Rad3-related DNA helicase